MSADYHIHILTGAVCEKDIEVFFANVFGSKYFAGFGRGYSPSTYDSVSRAISETPSYNIGEVSWLKAALFDGGNSDYIPGVIETINELIGEDLPVLDDGLISRILGAFEVPNRSIFDNPEGKGLKAFLETWKGNKVFSVSW